MNPRYPHTLIVSRVLLDENGNDVLDKKGDAVPPIVILESECGYRVYDRDVDIEAELIESDFKLSIPRNDVIIKKKDKVAFINTYTGQTIRGEVKSFRPTNFGSNIWFKSNE